MFVYILLSLDLFILCIHIHAIQNSIQNIEEVQRSGRSGVELQLKMLLDLSCVGRVIGAAGANIVNIKKKAGASLAQVTKEPYVSYFFNE